MKITSFTQNEYWNGSDHVKVEGFGRVSLCKISFGPLLSSQVSFSSIIRAAFYTWTKSSDPENLRALKLI